MSTFSLNKFLKNFLFVQSRSGLSIILGIASSAILARALGPSGRGVLALSMLLPTLLATFLNLGVSSANIYNISTKRFTASTVFKFSLQIWFFLSALGLLIGLVSIFIWGNNWFPNIPKPFLYVCLFLFPLNLLNNFMISIFQGQQRFKEYNLATLLVPVIELILIFLFLWIMNLGIWGAISAQAIGSFAALGIGSFLLGRAIWTNEDNAQIAECRRESINYGIRAYLSTIMAFVNYRADLFIINLFMAPSFVGIYTMAVGLAEKLWILSCGISTVLLPKLGELNKDEAKRLELTPFIARWVLVITALAASLTWFVIPYVIFFLYGENFMGAVIPFRILLIGVTLLASSRLLASDFESRGRPELNFYVALVIVTINISLNILLIPSYGMTGAAIATTSAYSVNFFINIFLYKHLSGCDFRQMFMPNSLDDEAFSFFMNWVKAR